MLFSTPMTFRLEFHIVAVLTKLPDFVVNNSDCGSVGRPVVYTPGWWFDSWFSLIPDYMSKCHWKNLRSKMQLSVHKNFPMGLIIYSYFLNPNYTITGEKGCHRTILYYHADNYQRNYTILTMYTFPNASVLLLL